MGMHALALRGCSILEFTHAAARDEWEGGWENRGNLGAQVELQGGWVVWQRCALHGVDHTFPQQQGPAVSHPGGRVLAQQQVFAGIDLLHDLRSDWAGQFADGLI